MNRGLQAARWIGLAVVATTVLEQSIRQTDAAVLQFRGDATIASVSAGSSLLPFNVAPGNHLPFTLSIDAVTSGGQTVYFASFAASIDNSLLSDSGLLLTVFNDRLGDSLLNLAEPVVVDDPGGYGDGVSISASYREAEARASGTVDTSPLLRFETTLGFLTSSSRLLNPPILPTVLADETVPVDDSTWNSFNARQLALTFSPGNARIGAYIDSLTQVPEPATLSMTLVGAIILSRTLSRRIYRLRIAARHRSRL